MGSSCHQPASTSGSWHPQSVCLQGCPLQTLCPAWQAQRGLAQLPGLILHGPLHHSRPLMQFEVTSSCLRFFSLVLSPPGWTDPRSPE